jgi:hypothetical protein
LHLWRELALVKPVHNDGVSTLDQEFVLAIQGVFENHRHPLSVRVEVHGAEHFVVCRFVTVLHHYLVYGAREATEIHVSCKFYESDLVW